MIRTQKSLVHPLSHRTSDTFFRLHDSHSTVRNSRLQSRQALDSTAFLARIVQSMLEICLAEIFSAMLTNEINFQDTFSAIIIIAFNTNIMARNNHSIQYALLEQVRHILISFFTRLSCYRIDAMAVKPFLRLSSR